MEYLIKTKAIGGMSEEQFFRFCQENDTMRFERNAVGDIILTEPTGSITGWYNMNIGTDLNIWNRQKNLGYVFDSNTGFTLPNKAVRSPDVAFIKKERWEKISPDDQKRFAHICPDFIIELVSETDNEKASQEKMKEWIDNGCLLAWMIDPLKKETLIYRRNCETETRAFSKLLNGEGVLPGFALDLRRIFTEN